MKEEKINETCNELARILKEKNCAKWYPFK